MSKLSSSRRVSFSSDQASTKPTALPIRSRKRVMTVFWIFRLPKSGRFLRRVGAKVAKVLRYVSFKKKSNCSSESSKNGGGGADSNFNRSHSVSESSNNMEESHRAEAVKDCINFFNSSSSSAL